MLCLHAPSHSLVKSAAVVVVACAGHPHHKLRSHPASFRLCTQGATMYDIDFDTAADEIKGLRKAVKGVQVMCAVVVGVVSLALPSAARAAACCIEMLCLPVFVSDIATCSVTCSCYISVGTWESERQVMSITSAGLQPTTGQISATMRMRYQSIRCVGSGLIIESLLFTVARW